MSERVHVTSLDAACLGCVRQGGSDYPQAVLFVKLPPPLPAQHRRRVDQHGLLDDRVAGQPDPREAAGPERGDIRRGRKGVLSGYQDAASLPDDVVRAWREPLYGTAESARQFQRLFTSLHARDLLAIEPALARLQVPTLIVWGTGDIFFRRKWAYWLRDTIPGATEVVEIDGARLFFPDERATELTALLRRHWDTHP